MNAVVDVTVAYREKVDPALALLLRLAEEMHAEETWSESLLAEPVLFGVQALTDSGVTLRVSLRTRAGEMFKVRREMYRRVVNAFGEAGIEMGMPHRRVVDGGAAVD